MSEAAARVPGELTSKMRPTLATAAAQCGYLPSLDKGHPCSLSSSAVVTVLGLAVEEELLSSAATELEAWGPARDSPLLYNCLLEAYVTCRETGSALRLFEEMQCVDCLDVVSYNTLLKAHLNAGRLDEAEELAVEMSSRGVRANRVMFNELLHARVLAKGMDGT